MDHDLLSEALNGLRVSSNDDWIEYRLYLDHESSVEDIQRTCGKCLTIAHSITEGYVWNHQKFNLIPVVSKQEPQTGYLYGRVRVGDAITDEWTVVYILRECTKAIGHLTVSVQDTDGELLLIEASNVIPNWITPQNSKNRVFIRHGSLHIVQQECDTEGNLSLSEGLKFVRSEDSRSICGDSIQIAAWKPIQGFPEQLLTESMHTFPILLPGNLCSLFIDQPDVAQLCCHRFMSAIENDEIKEASEQLKKLCDNFPENLQTLMIRVSRLRFSQLKMTQLRGYHSSIPGQLRHSDGANGSDEDGGDVAFKILIGLVLLLNAETPLTAPHEIHEVVCNEGEAKAASHSGETHLRYSIKELEPRSATPKEKENYYEWLGRKPSEPGDDELWLNTDPRAVDEQLREKYTDQGIQSGALELDQLVGDMQDFISNDAGLEGAEFGFDSNADISFNEDILLAILRGGLTDENINKLSYTAQDDKLFGKIEEQVEEAREEEEFGISMADVQEAMDEELAQTSLGKSFHRLDKSVEGQESVTTVSPSKDAPNVTSPTLRFKKTSEHLESSPSDASNPKPFDTQVAENTKQQTGGDGGQDNHNMDPIELNYNLVKNLLDSYETQEGNPGPVSNLLGLMGIDIPHQEPTRGHNKGKD